MSYRSLRASLLFAACSALLCITHLGADDAPAIKPPPNKPAPIKDREKPQNPANLTLDEVLRGWIQKAALIERLDADYSRITYDRTFGVMKIGKGKLAVDWMGRGFFIQSGTKDITEQPV